MGGRPAAGSGGRGNGAVDRGRLPSLLGYQLRRAQWRAFQDFARHLAPFDLTPGQLGALLLIEANRGLSQTALGRALGIERSSVVPLIDKLQRRGLVRRAARDGDRRAHALELSAGGALLLRRIDPALDAHERRVARRLTAAQRRTLMALLGRVAAE